MCRFGVQAEARPRWIQHETVGPQASRSAQPPPGLVRVQGHGAHAGDAEVEEVCGRLAYGLEERHDPAPEASVHLPNG